MTDVGALAVHAEESRPGGELLRGGSRDAAVRYAAVFAQLMAELAALGESAVTPPTPNQRWVGWDHADSGVWPAIPELDADFEAQNLRRHGAKVWAVHGDPR
ncbi:hypothetical protein [Streptomonospora litoralis]|uniref:Uncharacterized protein n=1 Tax=Streptomonospora litoralis TaxID=2498135 RepID=A0A4P6Q6Y9_9ACTN|nr:hypothetical protein [Streptomonospora litoralis]QBI56453.1 hypothetical protein EKD16_23530 [Streptomonospora litoralis]